MQVLLAHDWEWYEKNKGGSAFLPTLLLLIKLESMLHGKKMPLIPYYDDDDDGNKNTSTYRSYLPIFKVDADDKLDREHEKYFRLFNSKNSTNTWNTFDQTRQTDAQYFECRLRGRSR